jgi:hypothetical protein
MALTIVSLARTQGAKLSVPDLLRRDLGQTRYPLFRPPPPGASRGR